MDNNFLNGIKNVKDTERSLPEQVSAQIRQLIIDRRMEPGAKLPNEFELATQLNVGRGTVREAIKLLVARNVLIINRGKGTYIAKHLGIVDDPFGFDYMEDEERLVQELFEIRMHLEPWIASLAAKNATCEDIVRLKELAAEVEKFIDEGKDHLPVDEKFHVCIARSTQNRVLPKLIPVITQSVQMFGNMNQHSLCVETIETHRRIVDAINAHDPEAACEAMIEHLRLNRLSIPALVRDTK